MLQVRSGATIADRLAYWSHDDPATGCRVWHGSGRKYGHLTVLVGPKKRRSRSAHRLAWEIHKGPIPPGKQVLHNCWPAPDNPRCINIDHLWLGDHRDNMRDAQKKGRGAKGEDHGMAKLTIAQVRHIREDGGPNSVLARRYGVDKAHIAHIKKGTRWRHVA